MDRNLVYADYLALLRMNANDRVKTYCLQRIVSQCTNHWRVVGITKAALLKLAANDFNYVPNRAITRAHIHDRAVTFGELIRNETEPSAFWSLIAERDRTVLAVNGDNKLVQAGNYFELTDQGLFPPSGEHIYFASKSVGYRYSGEERDLLKSLFYRLGNVIA